MSKERCFKKDNVIKLALLCQENKKKEEAERLRKLCQQDTTNNSQKTN
jgi:hypothetical protein